LVNLSNALLQMINSLKKSFAAEVKTFYAAAYLTFPEFESTGTIFLFQSAYGCETRVS